MKKEIITILAFLGLLLSSTQTSQAQCKEFTQNVCKSELAPFIHDGVFNATTLAEGETIELYKTFYSDQNYRLFVCAAENLPNIEIQVLDSDRNILFDNTDKDFQNKWDFKLNNSQMLVISILVQSSEEMTDDVQQGCVSVMIGFDDSTTPNEE